MGGSLARGKMQVDDVQPIIFGGGAALSDAETALPRTLLSRTVPSVRATPEPETWDGPEWRYHPLLSGNTLTTSSSLFQMGSIFLSSDAKCLISDFHCHLRKDLRCWPNVGLHSFFLYLSLPLPGFPDNRPLFSAMEHSDF